MNVLRKILNYLQKCATPVTPVKNDLNAVTPLFPENRCLEETNRDKQTPESEIGVKAATPPTIDTKECLKEFDDILEGINKDVTKGASLEDIDDVLKDMAQENPNDVMLEVPKFDFEILKNVDIDAKDSLVSLADSIVSFSDIYIPNSNEVIEHNDVISISSEDSPPEGRVENISTGNTGNIDVNSINTEESKENIKHSKSIECEKSYYKDIGIEKQTNFYIATNEGIKNTNKPTDKVINKSIQYISAENSKEVNDLTTKDVVFMDDTDDGGYQSSEFEFITEEEAKMDGLIIHIEKNTHKRKNNKVNTVKTIQVSVDTFSNAEKSPRRKKIKRKTRNIDKDPDWAPGSETDSTSDDEFIPDDMEYLSNLNTRSKNNNSPAKSPARNNNVTFKLRQKRIPPRRFKDSPRFINLQINTEGLTSRNITEYNVDVMQNNEERGDPGRNRFRGISNECTNELVTMKMERNDGHLFKKEKDDLDLAQVDYSNTSFNIDVPEKVPDSIEIIPGSSFKQENHPDSNNLIKTNEMQDGPELNNIATLKNPEINNVDPEHGHPQRPEENVIPETSTENVPDTKKNNPGLSGIPKLDNFGAGPSCKRNRTHVDEIEKWRMYQMRTRLNRQFVVDFSYRDHHRVYQDHDLYQLFDPNRAPLPTSRSMRLLENKSTVCKNSMLVEYQGVGFNVPLRDSGSEDDEAKREANECAQKILHMYPDQNTRRSHRRRF